MNQLPSPNWGVPCNLSQFPPGFQPFHRPTFQNGHLPYAPRYMPGAAQHYMQPGGQYNDQINPQQHSQATCPGFVNPNQQQQQQRFNNSTIPSVTKPAVESMFTCDACSKDFKSRDTLNTHLNSHEMCDQEGCTFKASRKALKLHFIQIHAKGRMKIKLDTPEEIEKWKQERKRKFPTAANIAKKMALSEERKANGQLLETTNYSYRGHSDSRRGRGRGRGGRWHRKHQNQGRHNGPQQTNKSPHNGMPQQSRTTVEDPLALVLDINGNTSENINEVKRVNPLSGSTNVASPQPQASGSSALGALCASYGDMSSDDEDNDNTVTTPEVHSRSDKTESVPLPLQPSPNHDTKLSTKILRKPRNRNANKQLQMSRTARKPTLLEMLLASEVRHQRNVILQCLRYIVKKGFFQEGTDV